MKHIQILNCVLTLHFSATSLANVELKWANEVKHFCKNVPIILIANKIDIRSDQNNLDELVRILYTTEVQYNRCWTLRIDGR